MCVSRDPAATVPRMRRAVRLWEKAEGVLELGIAGIGLLRLPAAQPKIGAAAARELRAVLADMADPPRSVGNRTVDHDVVEGYGHWAETYDRPGNFLIDAEEPVVHELMRSFTAQPVLDAACGTGRHLAYLHAAGHVCIGVDTTPEMLERAGAKVPAADLRAGDLTDLPVADGEIGELVCTLALEHLDELGPAYAEFARVLRPGGHAVISTLHPVMSELFGWSAWFLDAADHSREVRTHLHSISDHLNAAIAAGFVVECCVEERISAELADLLAPGGVKTAGRAAYTGAPLVLAFRFRQALVETAT